MKILLPLLTLQLIGGLPLPVFLSELQLGALPICLTLTAIGSPEG